MTKIQGHKSTIEILLQVPSLANFKSNICRSLLHRPPANEDYFCHNTKEIRSTEPLRSSSHQGNIISMSAEIHISNRRTQEGPYQKQK